MNSLTTGSERLEIGSGQTNLLVTNSDGNTHGIAINGSRTKIVQPITLDDNGATFGNAITDAPIQVHGIADGTSEFDAVNFRQIDKVNEGVAMSMAMDDIPKTLRQRINRGVYWQV